MKRRHFIIPDRQAKPGVPLDHNRWLGYAIAEYEPDRLIDLGDDVDFPSISTYNSVKDQEGQRLIQDFEAANKADDILFEAMGKFRPQTMHKLMGNHNERLDRFLAQHPLLQGIVGDHLFNHDEHGWKVVPYRYGSPQVLDLDGIAYAHYFANVNTGKPIGGNASYKLGQIGVPFVQGHVQGYDIGTKQFATGRTIRGIVAGSCYLHDEEYKGMANNHWRGAVVLNEVEDGTFSEMPLTMNYLCQKYEGMSLSRFMQRKFKNAKERFTVANG